MPAAPIKKRRSSPVPSLKLRLLGELTVERDGERLPLPPSKKTRALLGYLLAEPREHTRERLCNLFWEDPSDPRGALRWSLSKLRQLLKGTGVTFLAEQERVSLSSGQAELDLAVVSTLCRSGVAKVPLEELEAAAHLFRGEFLEGLELPDCYRFQAWCTGQRQSARGQRTQVLEALIDRLPDRDAALRHALALVELDPAGQAGHRRVIRLLKDLGRRGEALRQYDACREALRAAGAQPDQQTEALRRSLGSGVGSELRSSSEPIAALPRVTAPASPPASSPVARETRPLVGRDAEWAVLKEALETGASNRLLMVLGDPGIGKSRLLEELMLRARQAGHLLLAGRSYEAELGRPYGCFIDAFRAEPRLLTHVSEELRPRLALLLPELGAAEANPDQARLLDAVAELLRRASRAQPVLLVLDDSQWIDESSAALAHYLVRTLRGERARLVGAARAGELPDNLAARRMLGALLRQDLALELRLGPLSSAAVQTLLASWGLSVDAPKVHRASQGNPFFALELGRALAEGREEMSGGLARALEQRLSLLGEESRSLLRWASAVGRRWSPGLLALASELPLAVILEALAVLERHGFIRALRDGSDYDFVHDLVREAIWNRIPAPQRQLYHARLAQTLWRQPDGESVLAGAVVRHALGAHDQALAARASVAAARYALRYFANGEAIVLVEQGLELRHALPETEKQRAQLALAEVLVHARSRPERLERLAAEMGDLLMEAEAMGLDDVATGTLGLLSIIHYFEEDEHRALSESLRSAELARASHDPLLRARALAQAGRCLASAEDQMGKARELLLEAQAELRGSPGMLLDIPLGLGLTHSFFGEVDAAHGWLEQTVRAADAAGDHWRSAEGSFGLVRLALAAGDAAAAVLNARKAVEVSEHLSGGHEPPLASGFLALAQLLAASRGEGSEVEAEQRFDETVEELKRIEAFWRASLLLILRAELELSRGRFTDALRFAQAGEPLRADEGVIKLVHCRAIQAEACLALGQLDDAQRYWALACQGELSARMRTRMATVKAALDRGSVTPRAHTDLQTSGR